MILLPQLGSLNHISIPQGTLYEFMARAAAVHYPRPPVPTTSSPDYTTVYSPTNELFRDVQLGWFYARIEAIRQRQIIIL
jgi:hypothetical protein